MNSLVIIKPDAVRRKLIGKIIGRLEERFEIESLKPITFWDQTVKWLYPAYAEKEFFGRIVGTMSAGYSILLKIKGDVSEIRAAALELRLELCNEERDADPAKNVIHASDCVENAERELEIFF